MGMLRQSADLNYPPTAPTYIVAPQTSRHSARLLMPFMLIGCLAVLAFFASFDSSLDISMPYVWAVGLTVILGSIVQANAIAPSGLLQIDLQKPESVYGLFYYAFYGVPMLMVCTGLGPAIAKPVEVSLLALAGFIAFVGGAKVGRRNLRRGRTNQNFAAKAMSTTQWVALMVSCAACIAVVAAATFVSIENGTFFVAAKAADFTQARLVSVLAPSIDGAVILLLGTAVAVKDQTLSRYAMLCLWGYVGVMMAIWILSSQFRPAFTGSIMFLIALQAAGKIRVSAKHLILVIVISAACLGITRSVREMNSGTLNKSTNQLNDSISLTQRSVESDNPFAHVISYSTVSRASGSIRFLSVIMESRDRGYDYVYGEMFVASLFNLVPRAVWPAKPAMEPFQARLKRHFGLQELDDPAGLLLYLYANVGWVGVLGGFYAVGWALAKFSQLLRGPGNVTAWIFAAFIWTSVVQIEQETILLTLANLRIAACVYVVYVIAYYIAGLFLSRVHPARTQAFNRWGSLPARNQ
jgi:hypothetical protein